MTILRKLKLYKEVLHDVWSEAAKTYNSPEQQTAVMLYYIVAAELSYRIADRDLELVNFMATNTLCGDAMDRGIDDTILSAFIEFFGEDLCITNVKLYDSIVASARVPNKLKLLIIKNAMINNPNKFDI